MSDYISDIRRRVGSSVLLQVPSVSVAIRDGHGRLLMARHVEGGKWLLPGGAIEPGEVPEDAARREAREETGLDVRITRLLGVFGGPDFIVDYANGDRTSYVMSLFEAVATGGDGRPDGQELLEMRYFTRDETRALAVSRWVPPVLDRIFGSEEYRSVL